MSTTKRTTKSNSYAVVTGASRGLGKTIAEELSLRGFNTILVGTSTRTQEVCQELMDTYHTQSVCFMTDLTVENNVLQLAEDINRQYDVFMLVNNAGTGGSREFADAPVAYLDNIINLNIRCTTLLTHQLLPNLMRQSRSHILNIGSMAAFTPTGYKTIYPASKSFVYVFSLGLREELQGTPVSVSVCSPGAMATNPDVTARIQKQGFWGRATLKSTESIARKCIRQTLRGKRQVIVNPIAYGLSHLVPTTLKTWAMSRIVKQETK